MTLAVYNGHEALTFTDYIDAATGKALHAVPGGTYDVVPASGRVVPDFPEPWFTPVKPADVAEVQVETPELEEAAGPDETGGDPETGEPEQF